MTTKELIERLKEYKGRPSFEYTTLYCINVSNELFDEIIKRLEEYERLKKRGMILEEGDIRALEKLAKK